MSSITERSQCIICLENTLESEDTVACTNEQIPHVFHRACALQWATTRPLGERVVCLLCSEGSFLPVEGSLTGNALPEELIRIQALVYRVDRNVQRSAQLLRHMIQRADEFTDQRAQRNQQWSQKMNEARDALQQLEQS